VSVVCQLLLMIAIMAHSSTSLIALLRQCWPAIALVIIVSWLASNKYQKHLAKIPGPAAAGYTKLWRLYRVYRGRFTWEQIKLHRELGPIVRIAPHVISIGDPKAIPIIYPSKQTFTKTAFYPIQSVSWKKQTETNIFCRYHARGWASTTTMRRQVLIA